jgi:N-acetylmuramoyl-L-alanine amidase
MPIEHTVQQGEHLARIAARYGFTEFQPIWDDPANADLKVKRQNPHVLFPGDIVRVPDKTLREEARATEARHKFRKLGKPLMLRIEVRNPANEPVKRALCHLTIDGKIYPLTTNARGRIEQSIPAPAETGRLALKDLAQPLAFDVEVKIGHLDPVTERSGQQGRLNNLGYDGGLSSEPADPQFKSAVEEFQCDDGLAVDGICGPQTQAKLKEVHGC